MSEEEGVGKATQRDGTPGESRATDDLDGNRTALSHQGHPSSFFGTEFVLAQTFSAERCNPYGERESAGPDIFAKARERPLAAAHWNVEVGGSGGYGWMGPCGARRGAGNLLR